MSKKAPRPLTIAPLQRVLADPITDPAEQAALDRAHQRAKTRRPRPASKTAGKGVAAKNRR